MTHFPSPAKRQQMTDERNDSEATSENTINQQMFKLGIYDGRTDTNMDKLFCHYPRFKIFPLCTSTKTVATSKHNTRQIKL